MGTGGNGLHFTDLICFLFDDQVRTYNTDHLDTKIIDSKRTGYVEFTGTLSGSTNKGIRFDIRSMPPDDHEFLPLSLVINTPLQRVFIQEGSITTVSNYRADNDFKPVVTEHALLFQSDLSKILVENALVGKPLLLTTYQESMLNHLAFTNALREFYNTFNNTKQDRCLIT